MKNKDYNRNVVIAWICNFVSLFILGFVFSSIAYSLFDKNYKNSMNSESKRAKSIVGKTVSSFLFFMSLSGHGQSKEIPADERMIVSCIIGLIGAVICFFVLVSKDEKIPVKKSKGKNNEEGIIDDCFKCDNCGALVSEDANECPKCHAKFIDEEEKTEKIDEADGKGQEEMFKCDNYGTIVKGPAKKCLKCEKKIENDSEVKSINDMNKKFSDLNKLKKLLDDKIITKEEFEEEKRKILK